MNYSQPIPRIDPRPFPQLNRKASIAKIREESLKTSPDAKPDRYLSIDCRCGAVFSILKRSFKNPDPSEIVTSVRDAAKRAGWDFRASGRHTCPNCLQKPRKEAMPPNPATNKPIKTMAEIQQRMAASADATASPDVQSPGLASAIRVPTPDQRRAIFRKLEDAYDEVNKRYIAPHTDKSLAEDLKFPRAWVSEIRELNFGPEGVDPVVAELRADLAQLRREAEARVTAHMDAAAKEEALLPKIDALALRIAKIETRR